LIAVNPGGRQRGPEDDYAIMKQVYALRASQAPAPNAIVMLGAGVNFRTMAPGENLYIVSHGDRDTGELPGISTQSLINWLNHPAKGVPGHLGKIVILSCYGGVAKQNTALAQQIAEGINRRGHDVEGATGFSFGTAEFSSTGHSSVLSENLREFYTAASVDEMARQWATMKPTHDGGVLADAPISLDYVNQYETIRNNLIGKYGAKGIDDRIRRLITHFQTRAHAIEAGLAAALNLTAGVGVAGKITTLEMVAPAAPAAVPVPAPGPAVPVPAPGPAVPVPAPAAAVPVPVPAPAPAVPVAAPGPAVPVPAAAPALPAHITSWRTLLAEQYKLFQDYYLWTDPAQAFRTFTS
jgi:hypothetical protein